jgi:molybdenum cofactor cytidylyltransferase
MSLPAIVLAAGASERMGSPKALLRVGGDTFVTRIVSTLDAEGVGPVVVVTGGHHDVIEAALAASSVASRVRAVRNPVSGADQLSSLLCGLDALDAGDVAAVLVALVDHPFVARATIAALVRGFLAARAPVVRPVCRGRHGHPVILSRETFDALRARPDGGTKAVVRAHAGRSVDVEVDDEGIWTDVDTPDAYRSALARFGFTGQGSRA